MIAHWISRLLPALAVLAALPVAGGSFAPGAVARPLVPAERRYLPYDGVLPACDDAAPLERIQSRFRDRENEFWRTGLEIVAFDQVKEIGYRSNGLDYIPRRYCQARVYLNDAKLRSVSYSIDKDLGFIGIDFGVEWCIAGLDRLDAYAPNCKMARP